MYCYHIEQSFKKSKDIAIPKETIEQLYWNIYIYINIFFLLLKQKAAHKEEETNEPNGKNKMLVTSANILSYWIKKARLSCTCTKNII